MTGPDGCQAQAVWVVGVGQRITDRQLSCGRHLNRTCQAMQGAEDRAEVLLTVFAVTG